MEKLNRRSFIHASAGVATGAAIAGAPAALVLGGGPGVTQTQAHEPAATVVAPSSAAPREPVMAYVRDAATGEVTVVSGTTETTYHDPALVARLLRAAPAATGTEGGELGVVTP